ncbi:dihydropteroate synthase [Neisseria sp. GT4A_CT1]|uniref:dihydropteroate synthase n=1 Tax=Neisseria sp. GT4A_CT1 TaxID=665946 RepID=UPI00022BF927|nr:dihydropteroate synthase [Neisseria sp. GT4A_CT1]EGY59931.1 dihydropteroate synthase [Neisseria sp. GT4A_CT1]
MTTRIWQAGRFEIGLDKPKIMGIVNLTPDSFSDGGVYSQNAQTALAHAEQLLKEGADILDIGGESTRPGADYVSPEEEWARVKPVLAEVAGWGVPVSLDTRRTVIMEKALALGGVDIINDIAALTDEGAVELLARQADTGICLMHMQGLPENMQINPKYQDVVGEVARYLKERAAECIAAGIAPQRITLDPGFGFGKNLQHNIALMRHLPELMAETGFPLLIGVSRKRMIGELTGEADVAERVHGSVAAALASVARGAQIVRVHDVKATADALKVWDALGITGIYI